MHFAGWKLGLKTGMYYLRTTAATAPIQFTVDQDALLVADTNVARERAVKKRPMGLFSGSASMTPTSNGVPTPTATPPPTSENKRLAAATDVPAFKADVAEGESPKALATEPSGAIPTEEQLPEPSLKEKSQEEDKDEDSEQREHDIYAEKVLACSIANPEDCIMCSG